MERWRQNAASVQFWDNNAKWYQLWIEHNAYHHRIIETITSFVRPGWKVLDIGAGQGILSLPLVAIGCTVTALEPSAGMSRILAQQALEGGLTTLHIEHRRWEDMPLSELSDFELIIASNSLHLTEIGFTAALEKIFLAKPLHAFVISEKQFLNFYPGSAFREYARCFEEHYSTESSYAYHCLEDALEHWSFKHERQPDREERLAIASGLCYENGHLWSKGSATVCMCWWTRKNAVVHSNISIRRDTHVSQDFSLSFTFHDLGSFR